MYESSVVMLCFTCSVLSENVGRSGNVKMITTTRSTALKGAAAAARACVGVTFGYIPPRACNTARTRAEG